MEENLGFDETESRHKQGTAALAESLAGANHPLLDGKEVLRAASGQEREAPLAGELAAGDHTIQFKDGRQFVLHIPEGGNSKELPVVFVVSPSVHTNQGYDAKNFEIETGMNQYADSEKFIAVYALPKKHLLGKSSVTPAEAWNAKGTGINDPDLKNAGYSDEDYIKSIVDILPRLARVDSSHKDWGAIAFSQGGPFVNQLVHTFSNLFPTIGLVGSTFETGYDYSTKSGNARNVMLVNLHGDDVTYPFPGEESLMFKAEVALVDGLDAVSSNPFVHRPSSSLPDGWGTSLAEWKDPLGAIDNRDQNPQLQQDFYRKKIEAQGPYSVHTSELPTPRESARKDRETVVRSLDPLHDQTLYIFDLATARHSYPGPDHGAYVNSTRQYSEFDTTRHFVDIFTAYNRAELDKRAGEK